MRQEVRDMAKQVANELLEELEYMTVFEIQEEYKLELTEEEAKWIIEAIHGAQTTLDPKVAGKIERLQFTISKLASHAGHDISEIVDEGWLEEGDMD